MLVITQYQLRTYLCNELFNLHNIIVIQISVDVIVQNSIFVSTTCHVLILIKKIKITHNIYFNQILNFSLGKARIYLLCAISNCSYFLFMVLTTSRYTILPQHCKVIFWHIITFWAMVTDDKLTIFWNIPLGFSLPPMPLVAVGFVF